MKCPSAVNLRFFLGVAAILTTSMAFGQSRLANISTRSYCGTGDHITIGGFVINGSATKTVLIRAVGPSLTAWGIDASEVLADPMIQLNNASSGNTFVASNDDWGSASNVSQIQSVSSSIGAAGLLATDTTSSAILVTLSPGAYTVTVQGKNATSGIVLLEVYDADPAGSGSTLVDISSRAYTTVTSNGIAVGGFVVSGSTSKQVLLRAVGPTLATLGLNASDVLADPTMELHDAVNGNTIVATNDNYGDNSNWAAIATKSSQVGAFALASSDTTSAVLMVTLQPGVYSFVVKGKNSTAGVVLIEIYDAD